MLNGSPANEIVVTAQYPHEEAPPKSTNSEFPGLYVAYVASSVVLRQISTGSPSDAVYIW
jgi:hypothetical protein